MTLIVWHCVIFIDARIYNEKNIVYKYIYLKYNGYQSYTNIKDMIWISILYKYRRYDTANISNSMTQISSKG